MGKFINTTRKNTIDSLTSGIKEKLKNPFYALLDKKPTSVTFFNINPERSTLDEGSRQTYNAYSGDSSLKYNRINDVLLYGMEKITTDLEVGDFGTESNDITGEAVLPPNIFKPYPNSYFKINHLDQNYYFRVNKVTTDTLDDGANFYKLEYVLEYIGDDFNLEKEVVRNFNFIADNIGTDYKPVLEDSEYEFIEKIQNVIERLQDYYTAIFFKDSLQTFVYKYNETYFYDPEVIEFIIRNHIFEGNDKYTFVNQAIYLPDTFLIEYDKSIYKAVEECSNTEFKFRRYYGIRNNDPLSLLSTRLEDYYIVTPRKHLGVMGEPLILYANEMISTILHNDKYWDKNRVYNIIGNYFNDKKPLKESHLEVIKQIDFIDTPEVFHMVPILIYILFNEVEKIAKLSDTAKSLL